MLVEFLELESETTYSADQVDLIAPVFDCGDARYYLSGIDVSLERISSRLDTLRINTQISHTHFRRLIVPVRIVEGRLKWGGWFRGVVRPAVSEMSIPPHIIKGGKPEFHYYMQEDGPGYCEWVGIAEPRYLPRFGQALFGQGMYIDQSVTPEEIRPNFKVYINPEESFPAWFTG